MVGGGDLVILVFLEMALMVDELGGRMSNLRWRKKGVYITLPKIEPLEEFLGEDYLA
jgi:hypothetical protein